MNAEAYARQLKQLLPPGSLWKLEPESCLSRTLLAIGDELARVEARAADLVAEWDPRTAVETLEDWERVLGISPPAGALTVDRQVAVSAQLVARGGQTSTYLVELATRLGFVATFAVVSPYVWRMTVDLAASSNPAPLRTGYFRAGASRAGDRLGSWTVPELEEEINKAKPAHERGLFAFTGG